jgi:hypothetical protein
MRDRDRYFHDIDIDWLGEFSGRRSSQVVLVSRGLG